jgi:hypothetical protein
VTWKWLEADKAKTLESQARQEANAESVRAQDAATAATAAAQRERDTAERERETARQEQAARLKAEQLIGEQYVTHGTQSLARQDISGALVWFAAALERDQADPERAQMHRIRLGSLVRTVPRPELVLLHQEPIRRAS